MPTNLRPNDLITDQKDATHFAATEVPIMSATQVTPDTTTSAVVILVTVYNLRDD